MTSLEPVWPLLYCVSDSVTSPQLRHPFCTVLCDSVTTPQSSFSTLWLNDILSVTGGMPSPRDKATEQAGSCVLMYGQSVTEQKQDKWAWLSHCQSSVASLPYETVASLQSRAVASTAAASHQCTRQPVQWHLKLLLLLLPLLPLPLLPLHVPPWPLHPWRADEGLAGSALSWHPLHVPGPGSGLWQLLCAQVLLLHFSVHSN